MHRWLLQVMQDSVFLWILLSWFSKRIHYFCCLDHLFSFFPPINQKIDSTVYEIYHVCRMSWNNFKWFWLWIWTRPSCLWSEKGDIQILKPKVYPSWLIVARSQFCTLYSPKQFRSTSLICCSRSASRQLPQQSLLHLTVSA